MDVNLCPECGAPEHITAQHLWLDNGDIIVKNKPENRIVFIESENFEPLFQNMARIIGAPIEHLVVSASRRAYRSYFLAFVTDEIKKKIQNKEVHYTLISDVFRDMGGLMGQGLYEDIDSRYEQDAEDYDIDLIKEPYYLLFNVGGQAAAIEALTDRDQDVTYEEVAPDEYRSKVFPAPHAEGLKERLQFVDYRHQPGDVELERCTACGGPKALSSYQWLPNRGVIFNRFTRRRMAFLGPQMLDPVFDELEAELGETIPSVAIEAQRLFTRSGFYSLDEVSGEGDFRTQLALRGLGNLKEIDLTRKGVRMTIDNAVLPLLVVGMMQGVFEMAVNVESSVDWELSDAGRLQVEISPQDAHEKVKV